MIKPTRAPLLMLLALVTLTPVAARVPDQAGAPDPTPAVRIVAPGDGDFLVGRTVLKAEVQPSHLASSITFFVDGREACSSTRLPFECPWDAGPAIAERQVRLAVTLVDGRRVVRMTRTRGLAFAETVDVDVVQITATVMDGRGRYVKGLPKAAFRVSENGRPQSITHFSSENVPLELLVAVDVSTSMRPAMAELKQAVASFLAAVPVRHHVTLLGFNDDVFTVARKQTDPQERMKAVERLTPWGATVLYDAIVEGVELLGAQPGRKALVVFTDGEDVGSSASIDEVEQALQASDLTLYMVGQGRSVVLPRLKHVMERLVRPTGGRALIAERLDTLNEAFSEILEELSNQYVVGYQPPNPARDGTWRQISVAVDGAYRVRARQGYRAVPFQP